MMPALLPALLALLILEGQSQEKNKSDLAGILVIGGYNNGGGGSVIPVNTNSSCAGKAYRFPRVYTSAEGGVAAQIDGKLTVCGGSRNDKCWQFTKGADHWEELASMDRAREYSAGARVDGNALWIAAGVANSYAAYDPSKSTKPTDTSIILKDGKVSAGPKLPYVTNKHCIVRVNETHLMLTGGFRLNGGWHMERRDAYMIDWRSKTWTKLKKMKKYRMSHGCALVEGNKIMVIGNGWTQKEDVSTEIFSLDSMTWSYGPYMPRRMRDPQIVPYGDSFVLVGGGGPMDPYWETYEYMPANQTWIQWPNATARHFWGGSRVSPLVVGLTEEMMAC